MFELEGKTRGNNILIDSRRKKLLNAISYISDTVKYPTKLKIFKLLFFIDFESFKRRGYPVTNLLYYAWEKGPVPKNLYNEFAEKTNFEGYFTITDGGNFESSKNYNLRVYSEFELNIIKKIIRKYKNTDDDTLIKITHKKGSPWAQTVPQEKIDYLLAIDGKKGLTKEQAIENYTEYLEIIYNYG